MLLPSSAWKVVKGSSFDLDKLCPLYAHHPISGQVDGGSVQRTEQKQEMGFSCMENGKERLLMKSIYILHILLLSSFAAMVQECSGKIVAIAETFTFLTAGKQQLKVRLVEIYSPERVQPYGSRARQALSDLIFGKEVRVVKSDTDRYGRLLG